MHKNITGTQWYTSDDEIVSEFAGNGGAVCDVIARC